MAFDEPENYPLQAAEGGYSAGVAVKNKKHGVLVTECVFCGEALPDRLIVKRAKYCNGKCKTKHERKLYRNANPKAALELPSGTTGAVGELLISIDLLRRGYEVFRALSPSTSCDLAVLKDGKLLRIEVTKGIRTTTGKFSADRHCTADYDILAVYFMTGEIIYVPELP